MKLQRINTYQDSRFSQTVLNQHGCFLADDQPIEVEITSRREAVIRGNAVEAFPAVIEEFRFYSPHITRFYDQNRQIVREYPSAPIFRLRLGEIQPSQFYVDKEKITAIRDFTQTNQDVVIQVIRHGGKYIALDGHTRLYYAVMMGWSEVYAVDAESGSYIFDFVEEAVRRGITSPRDLQLVDHETYQQKWTQFCDDYFSRRKSEA